MGAEAQIKWAKVKNNSKYFRLVKAGRRIYKKSGPNQKFLSNGIRRRKIKRNSFSLK